LRQAEAGTPIKSSSLKTVPCLRISESSVTHHQ
jgi:hypothetical protein